MRKVVTLAKVKERRRGRRNLSRVRRSPKLAELERPMASIPRCTLIR